METHCVHGLEELTTLKCPYYPKQSIDSMQSCQGTNDVFHRTRINIPKNIYSWSQETMNSNSNLEKEEQSWENRTT